MHKYNMSIEDILETPKKNMNEQCYQKWKIEIDAQYPINAHIIRELIKVKENRLQIIFTNEDFYFSYDEGDFIIDYLCVN